MDKQAAFWSNSSCTKQIATLWINNRAFKWTHYFLLDLWIINRPLTALIGNHFWNWWKIYCGIPQKMLPSQKVRATCYEYKCLVNPVMDDLCLPSTIAVSSTWVGTTILHTPPPFMSIMYFSRAYVQITVLWHMSSSEWSCGLYSKIIPVVTVVQG